MAEPLAIGSVKETFCVTVSLTPLKVNRYDPMLRPRRDVSGYSDRQGRGSVPAPPGAAAGVAGVELN